MAERTTYRAGTGNYAELDETLAAVRDDLAAREEGKDEKEGEGKGDGRGDAILDGAPRPVPGDELYDTLFQARAEKMNEQALAARHADEPNLDALLASYALGGRSQGQEREVEPDYFDEAISPETRARTEADWARDEGRISFQTIRGDQAAGVTSFPEAARVEIEQPSQDHEGRASVAAMGNEVPGPVRPGSQREAEPDYFEAAISQETRQETAERGAEQAKVQSRTKTMGFSL